MAGFDDLQADLGEDFLFDDPDALLADEQSPDAKWRDLARIADACEHAIGLRHLTQVPEQRPSDAQFAAIVNHCHSQAFDAVWDWRRQWRMNEAFKHGEFGATWNDETRALEYDEVSPRVHVPIYAPTLQVLAARMNATKPEWIVAPKSNDQAALDRARAANRIAKSAYQEIGVDEKRPYIVDKLLNKGTVFGKLTWNAKGGKYLGQVPIPMRDAQGRRIPKMMIDFDPSSETFGEPQVVLGPDQLPDWEVETDAITGKPKMQDAWEGAHEFSVIDPEYVLVNAGCTTWENRRWAEHFFYMEPAEIEFRYGFKGIHPDGFQQSQEPPWYGNTARPGRASRRSDSRTAMVRELYLRPGVYPASEKPDDSVRLTAGWIIVECQGQVRVMPNRYGDGPLVMRKADVGDEQFYGECVGNLLRGIQATFTREMSNWSFVNETTGNPRIVWPAGAGTPDEEKCGTPGAVLTVDSYRQEDHPHYMTGMSVAPGVEKFLFFIYQDILGYISGVREGGLAGGAPPNIEAAQALRILGERDATRLATTSLNYGLFLQDILKQLIHNIRTFARDSRMYALVGRDLEVECEEFAGADIDDDLLYLVVPESIRPQSDEVRRASALQLYTMGLATRRDTIIRLGELDGQDSLLEQRLVQFSRKENKQARREHQITTPLQKMQWEDQELSIDVHRAELFDPALADDPYAEAEVLVHLQIHDWLRNGMIGPFPGDPMMLMGFMPRLMLPPMMMGPGGATASGGPAPTPTQAGGFAGMESGASTVQ